YLSAGWKAGKDYMAPIRRVCTLKAPLHLRELREHPVVRFAGFVRGGMRGRYRASSYWPDLHRMIVARNPSARSLLSRYGPARLGWGGGARDLPPIRRSQTRAARPDPQCAWRAA